MSEAEAQDRQEADDAFGDSLTAAARAIIADARSALSDPQLSDAEAVHDIRRAFKRWRALMRLLAKPIGEPAERLRIEARDLMRTLSGSRDVQAALDALADLGKSDLPMSATTAKTIEARLTKLRSEAEAAHFTPELRQQVASYLEAAERTSEQWPLTEIDFDAIADAMTRTYTRGRDLIPSHWLEAEAEDLHELRKRVVEHRHQMELLDALWPRLGKVWAQEAQRLRERLGACQDLAVFATYMAPRGPLAPWRSRLQPLIEDRRRAHLNAAAKLAGRLFAEKPKAFRSRIRALWSARQSNTP
ncbi:MAG: CHAD domain-containing protein [Pseudolabrys sp.]|nr:CHAD domain-containing protein [Pseudolabrys sp.]